MIAWNSLTRPDGVKWTPEAVDRALADDAGSSSVYAPDYRGIIAMIGKEHRLTVNSNLRSFVVQRRHVSEGVEDWRPLTGGRAADLSVLLDRCDLLGNDDLAGLRSACAGLASSPVSAAPDFALWMSARGAAFAFNDWRLADYRRVLARVDGWRVVVAPDASAYFVQKLPKQVLDAAYDVSGAFDCWEIAKSFETGPSLLKWLGSARVTAPPALSQALRRVPEYPDTGDWPDLPVRPPVAAARRSLGAS